MKGNLNGMNKLFTQPNKEQLMSLYWEKKIAIALLTLPSVDHRVSVLQFRVNHLDLVVYECSEHLQTPDVQQVLLLLLCLTEGILTCD